MTRCVGTFELALHAAASAVRPCAIEAGCVVAGVDAVSSILRSLRHETSIIEGHSLRRRYGKNLGDGLMFCKILIVFGVPARSRTVVSAVKGPVDSVTPYQTSGLIEGLSGGQSFDLTLSGIASTNLIPGCYGRCEIYLSKAKVL